MTEQILAAIAKGLGSMFSVAPRGDLVRIRTPFWYPDGGVVDLFLQEHTDSFTLTDLGEALGWLRMQSLSPRRTSKQQKLVQDVCLTQNVELFKGQLLLRCEDSARLSESVFRLGQAVVRVADVWFTTRTRSVESTSDEVVDFLQDRKIDFERGVKLGGRSGRNWTVDIQTRTAGRSTLVFLLATGSRAAARRLSEHVVTGWHDLSFMKVGATPLGFVSLFDDTSDVWADEDFKLVESVSEIARWSKPDEFEEMLRVGIYQWILEIQLPRNLLRHAGRIAPSTAPAGNSNVVILDPLSDSPWSVC